MTPLVPAHIDLRDFPYMPLDVVRLRDSDLAAIATGDGFRAAVMIWCAAWHQIPAASLPDDDRMLARLAGYGRDLEAWKAVKDDALRNFVKCDDGRLYHPTIAEKAREAWEAKVKQRDRTAAARAARLAAQSNRQCDGAQSSDATASVTEPVASSVTESKGREGKGREETASSPLRSEEAAAAPPPLFDREDFRRRCEEAAGCGELSGFDLIEAMAKTHDPEARILPVLREKGAALRRKGKKPEGWAYFLPAIRDPECIGAQPCAKAPPVVWLDAGSPEFIAANRAMVARGEPPKTAIAINSQPNRGASFPAWAVEPAREAAE